MEEERSWREELFTAPKLTTVALLLTVSISVFGYNKSYALAQISFVAALLVGVVAFGVAVRNSSREKSKKRKVLKILGTLSIPVLGLSVLVGSASMLLDGADGQVSSNDDVSSVVSEQPVTQEETAKGFLDSTGVRIRYDNLSLVWSDNINEACEGVNSESVDIAGCFVSEDDGSGRYHINNKIIMRTPYDESYVRTAIAHEFLHYVWYNYDLSSDNLLADKLTHLLQTSPAVQERLKTYPNKDLTEVLSYACTEMDDNEMDAYIVGTCNKYIDTKKLRAYY